MADNTAIVVGTPSVVTIKAPTLAANVKAVEIKDAQGNVVGRGAVSGASKLSAAVLDSEGKEVGKATVNRGEGDAFIIKFTPEQAGTFTVVLRTEGKDVAGAKQEVTVLPRIAATLESNDIDGDWNADFKFAFEGSSPTSLLANIVTKDGKTKIEQYTAEKNEDGTWNVKFSVPECDGLKIDLVGDGRAVENDFEVDLS